jgi:uridylate kinase
MVYLHCHLIEKGVAMLKRTVIKLSGEALGNKANNQPYDDGVIGSLAAQIKRVLEAGTQVALVVGGGNLWRGRMAGPGMDTVKADQMGMLATVMNGIYLAEALKRGGVAAKVAAPIPIGSVTMLYEKDYAIALMAGGTVIINAAGLGHPCFSTDTVTALRAAELECDCVLYAKSVDGVYEADPRKNPSARKYRTLRYATAISNNLDAADITALHLSKEAGIPSFMFSLTQKDSLILACSYPETGPLQGTYIHTDAKEDFYV